jgi:hypothetical protein
MKKLALVNLSIVLCAIPLSFVSILYMFNPNQLTILDRVSLIFSPLGSRSIWSGDGAILAIPFVTSILGTVLATIRMRRITSHVLASLITALWVLIVWGVAFVEYGP